MLRILARPGHALLLVCVALFMGAAGDERTALDEYVAKPDPNYAYKLVNEIKGDGVTTYVLEMTSQQWLTPEEVDHSIWKHWLTIVKPDVVERPTALMYITGGNVNSPAPQGADES